VLCCIGDQALHQVELKKGFIMPIKGNRYRVALSLEDKKWGDYEREATLKLDAGEIREVYVEQAEFPLVLPVNGGPSRTRNRRRGCPVVLVQQRRNVRLRAPNPDTRKTVESGGVSQGLKEYNASLVNSHTKTARTDHGPMGVNLTRLI
jgi:hypothetical protein